MEFLPLAQNAQHHTSVDTVLQPHVYNDNDAMYVECNIIKDLVGVRNTIIVCICMWEMCVCTVFPEIYMPSMCFYYCEED